MPHSDERCKPPTPAPQEEIEDILRHLWETALEGEPDAIEALCLEIQRILRLPARRWSGKAVDPEDILQAVVAYTLERLARNQQPDRILWSLTNWTRSCATALRRPGSRSVNCSNRLLEGRLESRCVLLKGVTDRDCTIALWTCVRRLQSKDRRAVLLYYRRGASTSQIAIRLAESKSMVRRRLRRARVELKRALQQTNGGFDLTA